MNFLIADIESTGLLVKTPPYTEVVQFSGLLLDDSLEIIRVINRYCIPGVSMDAKAQEIHNLSIELLETLSDGKNFATIATEEDLHSFSDVTWVFYNSSFDMKMINNTLIQQGVSPINFGRRVSTLSLTNKGVFNFDLMPHTRSLNASVYNISLSVAITKLVGYDNFRDECVEFAKKYQIDSDVLDGFHNAVYDCLAVRSLILKYRTSLFW